MSTSKWDTFGYDSSKGCEICKKKPGKMEPRFNYIACKEHSKLSPVKFSEERKKKRYG